MEIKSSANTSLRYLSSARQGLESSFKKLSSGLRITSAKDDAAGLAIVESLLADDKQLGQGIRNASDGVSLVQIAEGTLSNVSDSVSRLQELATQASNGTLSDTQRASLDQEFQAISQEINRQFATTEFNGRNVFDSDTSLQVGLGSGENAQINVQTGSSSSITSLISGLSVSTADGAKSALDSLSQASAQIGQSTGQLGAIQARLEQAISNNQVASENVAAAASRIRDLDVASETAKNVGLKIREQASAAVLAQTGKLQASNVKKLLG